MDALSCYVGCYVAAPILPELHPPCTRMHDGSREETAGFQPLCRWFDGPCYYPKLLSGLAFNPLKGS
jgi:hypothetical protein